MFDSYRYYFGLLLSINALFLANNGLELLKCNDIWIGAISATMHSIFLVRMASPNVQLQLVRLACRTAASNPCYIWTWAVLPGVKTAINPARCN
jgi:hypothetical protein